MSEGILTACGPPWDETEIDTFFYGHAEFVEHVCPSNTPRPQSPALITGSVGTPRPRVCASHARHAAQPVRPVLGIPPVRAGAAAAAAMPRGRPRRRPPRRSSSPSCRRRTRVCMRCRNLHASITVDHSIKHRPLSADPPRCRRVASPEPAPRRTVGLPHDVA